MNEVQLVGGAPEDRKRILERFDQYLAANARFDWAALQDLWSGAPEALFFNLNGHTYRGREHWTSLWKYYRQNVDSSYWTPFDIGGVVSDELAVIWRHRHTHSDWIGKDPAPASRPMAKNSSHARRWCSARRPATGASSMCISPRPAPRRDRAACDPRQAIMAGLPRIAIRLDGALRARHRDWHESRCRGARL